MGKLSISPDVSEHENGNWDGMAKLLFMDWVAIGSFIASIPGGLVGAVQLRQMARNTENEPTFRQNHPQVFASLMTLMVVGILAGIGFGWWSIFRPAPRPASPPVVQQPTSSQPPLPVVQSQKKTPTQPSPNHLKRPALGTGRRQPPPAAAVSTPPASIAPAAPASTAPTDNCLGKNTFKNVNIHAKYAVSLTTLCNDFEGGTIDGEETGVTVSIPLDEQTGKPVYVPVIPRPAPSTVPSIASPAAGNSVPLPSPR